MATQGERKKDLGSGMLEDARKKITKRNKRLREACEGPGSKRYEARGGESD